MTVQSKESGKQSPTTLAGTLEESLHDLVDENETTSKKDIYMEKKILDSKFTEESGDEDFSGLPQNRPKKIIYSRQMIGEFLERRKTFKSLISEELFIELLREPVHKKAKSAIPTFSKAFESAKPKGNTKTTFTKVENQKGVRYVPNPAKEDIDEEEEEARRKAAAAFVNSNRFAILHDDDEGEDQESDEQEIKDSEKVETKL